MSPGPGTSHPLGAHPVEGGVNFSVFASRATSVSLLLFEDPTSAQPAQVIELDPVANRTRYYWHVFVPGIGAGQTYAYRVEGPQDPARGLLFDGDKLLVDPYARAIAMPEAYDRAAASRPGDNVRTAMRGLVVDPAAYDWEDDRPPRHGYPDTVIYEMHVGGFTKHPSSGVAAPRRGTFRGLVEKIPYLVDLGITAVELMPVFQFDPQDAPPERTNYWGYSPVAFFAPHVGYAVGGDPSRVVDEFRDMVKALHRADIEVILDVVYNHSAEGGAGGPTQSFRGFGSDAYYMLGDVKRGRRAHLDFTGCGNTLNANHPVVRRMILDSLRYWVEEMHVDGFRFDLAAVLSRDKRGRVLEDPPVLWEIDSDPVLARTKLIAEAWDATGLDQVGRFLSSRWKEWNGRFRDDVRRFLRGDEGSVEPMRDRYLASPDLYEGHYGPETSVNFVTSHDGFTLNDLVTYTRRRNRANGEGGRDGWRDNLSWNCGREGPSDDPQVERLRRRQIRNFLATTFTALGTPMLLMGDEMRRTQRGNNNPYCQDNEISWLDWTLLETNADLHRFTKRLIALRRNLTGEPGHGVTLEALLEASRVEWHGVELGTPDWGTGSRSLAFTIRPPRRDLVFHVVANAWHEGLEFQLPQAPGGWQRLLDTAQEPPDDVSDGLGGPHVPNGSYRVEGHSMVVLVGGEAAAESP